MLKKFVLRNTLTDPDGCFELNVTVIAETENEAREKVSKYCNDETWLNPDRASCEDVGLVNSDVQPGVTSLF